ncbi:MAG: nuclear transport factor 2 family protein [Limnohabitans sp.]|nr:nuclear transport factor 2 family protein [Limnohabitans sp.]
MDQQKRLQQLLDRTTIQDVLNQYFRGLDRSDSSMVKACFTPDVISNYDGRSSLRSSQAKAQHGIDSLMNSLLTFKKHASGEWKITSHFMGNFQIEFTSDHTATTETYAIAHIVLPNEPNEPVVMRGFRYLDRWRKDADEWRICERTHTLDWSYSVPSQFAISTQERVNNLT